MHDIRKEASVQLFLHNLRIFYYSGNIARWYFWNNDKSTLRSGAHRWAPCAHRNLRFRYAHFCPKFLPAFTAFAMKIPLSEPRNQVVGSSVLKERWMPPKRIRYVPVVLKCMWTAIQALHDISAGKMEGINNKIKTLRRQAYGYPDDEYFFLKLLDMSRQRYVWNPKSHKKSDWASKSKDMMWESWLFPKWKREWAEKNGRTF